MYKQNSKDPPGRNYFKFTSDKTHSVIKECSRLVNDACHHLEYAQSVIQYETLPHNSNKNTLESKLSLPTFKVIYQDDSVNLIQVMRFSETRKKMFHALFAEKQEEALKNNTPLILITEKQIRVNPKFDNLKLLHRYSGAFSTSPLHKHLLTLVQEGNSSSVGDLAEQCAESESLVLVALLQLVSHGLLHMDISECELGQTSKVWLNTQGNMLYARKPFVDEFRQSSLQTVRDSARELDNMGSCLDLDSSPPTHIPRDLESYSEETKQEALRRQKLLLWIQERNLGGWTEKRLVPLLEEASDCFDFKLPNWRIVAQWWGKYKKSSFDIYSLVPKTGFKGNRRSRFTLEEERFMDEAIKRWLKRTRPSVAEAYEFYTDSVCLANENRKNKLKAASYNTLTLRIKRLPEYEVMLARFGKIAAEREFGQVGKFIAPHRILERVEMDHTPLDIILLDDMDLVPLGRPILTALMDIFSKSIIGFHYGYNDPSFYSVSKAIINALMPKNYLRDCFPEIENHWACEGKIETLFVDNAAEFWGRDLEYACQEIGINIQYNPPGKPWLRPNIERLYGTINSKLLVDIPGKTLSRLLESYDYDPAKTAVMRVSSFNLLLHKWVVDVYQRDTDARKTRLPPYIVWEHSFNQLPPQTYSEQDLEKLKVITCMKDERVLRKGGIHILSLRYENSDLNNYRRYHYKSNEKLVVRVNPDDISSIYVLLKEQGQYLKVGCVDPEGYTKNLSLFQHQVNLKLHRNYVTGTVDTVSLARVRMDLKQMIENEVKNLRDSSKRKTKLNKRLAKYNNINSCNNNTLDPTSVEFLDNKPHDMEGKRSDDLFLDWDDLADELDPF